MLLLPLRDPFKCHEEVLSLQPMFPPTKRFDMFSSCTTTGFAEGCSEGLDAFRRFFKQQRDALSGGIRTYSRLS